MKHLPLKTGNLLELLETQLDPKLTLAACCFNLPEWALPTLNLIWLSLTQVTGALFEFLQHAKYITISGLCTGNWLLLHAMLCPEILA